jgi:hypothetical protein
MTNLTAIATKLNVLESAIVRIEEWTWVMFVVVKGLGARFVSKKVVAAVKMETKLDRADKIVKELGYGKTWTGGNVVRVYFGSTSGYIEIGTKSVNCQKLKHSVAFMAIREAGLLDVTTDLTNPAQHGNVARRGSCLNCGITNTILMGRGYCTDCHGECD